MVFEVTTAVLVAWRGLAYVAARDAVLPAEAGVPEEVSALPTWQIAFAEQWSEVVQILSQTLHGTAVMSEAALADVVESLAERILGSMTDLGFFWDDEDFIVDHTSFDSAGFLTALDSARKNAVGPLRRFRARRRREYARGGRIP